MFFINRDQPQSATSELHKSPAGQKLDKHKSGDMDLPLDNENKEDEYLIRGSQSDGNIKSSQNDKKLSTNDPANLLEYLFEFVDSEEDLNPVLCGYFSKLVKSLIKRNPRKVICY